MGRAKTPTQNLVLVAEYLGKRLIDRPAKWAGGPLKDKPRKMAMIAAEGTEQNDAPSRCSPASWPRTTAPRLANIQRYDDPLALGTTGQAMLSQFKSEGITSIVFVGGQSPPRR
ncbi:MAG: hypothetical protein IPH81_20335 [Candidatus Microthrix sp.]|nr:hypothetical protein [Candidatus Microthrix sp.]